MLSPNVIDTSDALAQALANILNVDALAYAGMNTLVGTLSPDPAWLGKIRNRITLLSDAGAQWQKNRPTLWSEVLAPFNSYYALMAGFTEATTDLGNNPTAWKAILQQLSTNLASAIISTKVAEAAFQGEINNLRNVEELLTSSLDDAWQELAEEEQTMVRLAAEIGSLQTQLNDLESNLSATELSDGKSYVKSTVTIAYSILSSTGESIPYLSIAGLLFTVGDLAYNMIVTDNKITDTINNIVSLRNQISQEAQAAAMTKAIIQMINNFDKQLLAVESQLPDFSAMWKNEQAKVDMLIDAIDAGATPGAMTSIVAMPVATASWKQLSELVTKMAEATEQGTGVKIVTSDSVKPIQRVT